MPIEATRCQLFRGLLVHAAEGKFSSKADNVKAFAHCMRHGVVPCREDFNVAVVDSDAEQVSAIDFGQLRLRPITTSASSLFRVRPISTSVNFDFGQFRLGPISTSANFDFGQFDFGQFLDVEFWDDKGWSPEGWPPSSLRLECLHAAPFVGFALLGFPRSFAVVLSSPPGLVPEVIPCRRSARVCSEPLRVGRSWVVAMVWLSPASALWAAVPLKLSRCDSSQLSQLRLCASWSAGTPRRRHARID